MAPEKLGWGLEKVIRQIYVEQVIGNMHLFTCILPNKLLNFIFFIFFYLPFGFRYFLNFNQFPIFCLHFWLNNAMSFSPTFIHSHTASQDVVECFGFWTLAKQQDSLMMGR
jgi:hypothetical protein